MNSTSFLSIAAIALLFSCTVRAESEEPGALTRLRSSYDGAVQRAIKPLAETYVTELSKLQETSIKNGKLDDALKIAAEIKIVKEKLQVVSTEVPAVSLLHPKQSEEKLVTIAANDMNGFLIGSVKRGDSITLQYSGGLWKHNGNIASANPDDPNVQDGDLNRLVIARAPVKGKPGDVTKIVPAETTKKAFTFIFPTTRDDMILRINDGSDRKQNPGAVTYSMKLTR
jgi:hypothetical protein